MITQASQKNQVISSFEQTRRDVHQLMACETDIRTAHEYEKIISMLTLVKDMFKVKAGINDSRR